MDESDGQCPASPLGVADGPGSRSPAEVPWTTESCQAVVMADGILRSEWIGRHVVVPFPKHLRQADAAQTAEQLLNAIRDGATVVVADMSATVSCDHAGIDLLSRAYLRASITQAELRLVVATAAAAELVAAAGLDRLVAVFPSASAALTAPEHDRQGWSPTAGHSWPTRLEAGRGGGSGSGRLNAAVLRALIDSLEDGIVLTDDDGTILLASRRLASMFGYDQGELVGRPVESLVRGDLREAHREHRIAYGLNPLPRPMGQRTRLAGARKDGSSVPVTITLSPVPTASGQFVLGVVRDATRSPLREDLASMAWAAAAEQDERGQELLGRVVTSLFHVGLSLQAAANLPAEPARERLADALGRLDEVIHQVRGHVFRSPGADHHG
jgi:PAS domain S-box-containing protein